MSGSEKIRVACVLSDKRAQLPNACAYIRLILPLTRPSTKKELDVRFVQASDIAVLKPHVVIVQRLAVATERAAKTLIGACASVGAKLIYELDDDLLAIAEDHPEFHDYREGVSVVRLLASSASEVWTSTEVLGQTLRDLNVNTIVIPNELDSRIWRTNHRLPANQTVRILYMGTTSHYADLQGMLLGAFAKLRQELGSKVSMSLIGIAEEPPKVVGLEAVAVPEGVGVSYPAFANWLQSLAPFDIGVAPLLDTKFNAAKSSIKWLEYSALNLATVASKVGEYSSSIAHGESGLLAAPTGEDFYLQLRKLTVDRILRDEVAACAATQLGSKMGEQAGAIRLQRLKQLR